MRTTLALLAFCSLALIPSTARAQLTLELTDYLQAPMTGKVDGRSNQASLARINVMREEPGGRGRFFICDLNGPLYIVDKARTSWTTYLDFNGAEGRPGMFKRFTYPGGFATGLIGMQFDPAYAENGRFYTIHMEDPMVGGTVLPDTRAVPGLDTTGYRSTEAFHTPGPIQKETVLIEWTDTNPADTTFQGTARELLRIETNSHIHPMGDVIFNPTARPGGPEWGVMYIASGDGGSGEQRNPAMRHNPQRLDTVVGKILRIIPDLSLHTDSSTVSANGRYRVPNDNPFVDVEGAHPEIWALGLRNPHRLTWTTDAEHPERNRLIANTIGLHTWEAIYIVTRGANYGYSEREGNELLAGDNSTRPLPSPDQIPLRVSDTVTHGMVTPAYPVAQYPHRPGGGDAIAGGVLYRGSKLPALRGKYLFGDISTGTIWYLDYDEMLAADDGNAATQAERHLVQVRMAGTSQSDDSMWRIVEDAYHARGGKDPDLPGASTVSGAGRVDMRFAEDAAGELYIFSKSDGMIRAVTGAIEK